MNIVLRSLVVIICINSSLNAQNIIQDTLTISIKQIPENEIPVVIDTVIDAREEDEFCIGTYEVKKYWIVPVDLLIQTDRPLRSAIKNIFSQTLFPTKPNLRLLIDKFELSKNSNSYIYPHYKLNASIQIYKLNESDKYHYLGRLIYEKTRRKKFISDDLKKGFEVVVEDWQHDFVSDLESISKNSRLSQDHLPENFRTKNNEIRWKNFYSSFDYIFGLEDQLLDGEIYFSDRESRRFFYRNGYGIRYRNSEAFESIELGLSIDFLQYRINPSFMFKLKTQLFVGFNNWNDFDVYEHEFYDAFIGDFSFSQSLVYNPIDKRSLIFGIGLAEDLTYIYSQIFRIHAGILFHLGVKL